MSNSQAGTVRFVAWCERVLVVSSWLKLSDTQLTLLYVAGQLVAVSLSIFMRESSYCFRPVLAIAILPVCLSFRPSVTQVDQSKMVQARITKSSPSAAWKTLVSGTVKLLHKLEGGHPKRGP